MRRINPEALNKGYSFKSSENHWQRQTPENDPKVRWTKQYDYKNNQDKDNSLNTYKGESKVLNCEAQFNSSGSFYWIREVDGLHQLVWCQGCLILSISLLTKSALNGWEHGIKIHGFSPNWLCLFVELLATRANKLHPHLSRSKCLWVFLDVMARFKIEKPKLSN